MVFTDSSELFDFIENHNQVSDEWKIKRSQNKELVSLILGEDFVKQLNQVSGVEGVEKASVRKQFARPVIDLFERLGRNYDNIYKAHGTNRDFDISNKSTKEKVQDHLNSIRGGKSLPQWLEKYWRQVESYDPDGVIFLEYDAENEVAPYPTYKSIQDIRYYESDGQTLEVLLFEPISTDDGELYRIVDDEKDYTVLINGDAKLIVSEFDHPFGIVPGYINSDCIKIGTDIRLSPYNKIVPMAKEYLSDQSFLSIYKPVHGSPIHWRYAMLCRSCNGTKKDDEGNTCPSCDGKGFMINKDVANEAILPIPEGEQKALSKVAGYEAPDLETWDKYREELKQMEHDMHETMWGGVLKSGDNETATGRFIDFQPIVTSLEQVSDSTEAIERFFSEMIINYFDNQKDRDEKKAKINLGRMYLIEPANSVLSRYEDARSKNVSDTILDNLLEEYLISKFKNDNIRLSNELKRTKVEPYVHMTVSEVNDNISPAEAHKKALFKQWWDSLTDISKDHVSLRSDYDQWLNQNKLDNGARSGETVPTGQG